MSSSWLQWHSRWHTRQVRGLAALAALGASSAAPAWADCARPEPSIVWSHPAQGATDVPTNTDLWLLPTGWNGPPRVTLRGTELPALALPFGYDLGELPASTEITLHAESDGETLELTFTTGSGPSAPDPGASPGQVGLASSREHPLSPLCQAALNTQDCFDTGQNTHFEFAPTGRAVGWVIVSDAGFNPINLWPGECGPPQLFRYDTEPPCVVLHGIDESGATHAGEKVCGTYPGEGPDLLLPPAQPATGTPGVVLPPANAPANESDGDNSAASAPSSRENASWGCALGRAPNAGGSLWALALLGMLGGWRAARRSPSARTG